MKNNDARGVGMNANELAIKFIQRHGYEFAKHILGDFFGSMTHVTNDGRTFLNCNHPDLDIDIKKQLNSMVLVCDVKRLVESWELLESFFNLDALGFDKCIEIAKKQIKEFEVEGIVQFWHRWDDELSCTVERMKRAIEDVESVGGGV